ncbi:MAG: tRNA (adenosine(37)-N6)-threonylcarbamoyltransferase complex ATPase subunit type 1 TsaE, partial [Bacteroidota bacterium]
TFNYVNSYKINFDKIFYHFDLYRLDSLNSFLDLGFNEYFYKENSFSFVEWPGIIKDYLENSDLKDVVCQVYLSFEHNNEDEQRRILEII